MKIIYVQFWWWYFRNFTFGYSLCYVVRELEMSCTKYIYNCTIVIAMYVQKLFTF